VKLSGHYAESVELYGRSSIRLNDVGKFYLLPLPKHLQTDYEGITKQIMQQGLQGPDQDHSVPRCTA
jgi:hypothetical protein